MALALTGCKNEATISVSVKDANGAVVPNRYVFYTSQAAAVAENVLPPTPEELLGLGSSTWSYVITNNSGVADITFDMGVAKATYYFCVYDYGTSDSWKTVSKQLRKGKNDPIDIKVVK